LYSVFNLTWTESASININSEDKNEFFSRILDFVLRFFGSLCLGTIAIMPYVFNILINEKFNDAYFQIPILIVGSMFNILVSFLGSVYVAKKLTKEIAKTSVIAAVINIAVNVVLIRQIGLYAASISTLVAYALMFIYRWIDVKKYVDFKVNKILIMLLILIYSGTIFTYYLKNTTISIIMLLVVVLFAIIINKNSVTYIKKIVNETGYKKGYIELIINYLTEMYDVFSLTYTYEEYMWDAYASEGNGICVVYNVGNYDQLYPVEYCEKNTLDFTKMIINALKRKSFELSIIPWVVKNPYNETAKLDSTKEKEVRMLYCPYDLAEFNGGQIQYNIKERKAYKGIAKSYTDFELSISRIIIGRKCTVEMRKEVIDYAESNDIQYSVI